jgi:hypothetical protein
MRWEKHIARMGEMRNEFNISVRKPEGKRPLGRTRRRWEDNIKMNLGEIVWEFVDWMHLAKDSENWRAVVITVMNFPVL